MQIFFVLQIDIDECQVRNGGCTHQCTNLDGLYKCKCPTNMTLNANGFTCEGLYLG